MKEQRDEAVQRANKRVNDSQVGTLAVDASFITDASLDKAYTIEARSHESQNSLDKDSNTTADPSESETLMNELMLDHEFQTKCLRKD